MPKTPGSDAHEGRRNKILDVALACFLAEGYGATSMSTIAARVGGSKGTIYNYFNSKEDLFGSAVRYSSRKTGARLAAFPEGLNTRDSLLRMAEDLLEHFLSPNALALYRLLIGEADRFPALARVFYEADPKIMFARYAQVLGTMMELGLLRRGDPALAAQQFNGLVVCGIYLPRLWGAVENPTPAARAEQAKAAVDTFLRAYAPTEV